MIVHVGIVCATDTTSLQYNLVPSVAPKPMIKDYNKSRKSNHAKCKQDLPKYIFFLLDLSDVNVAHNVTELYYKKYKDHNLDMSDVKIRSTPKKITHHLVKLRDIANTNFPAGSQILPSENDDIGKQEYC